jgi:hypothetical protein
VTPDPSTGETVVRPASEPAKPPRRTRPEGKESKRSLNFSDLDAIEFDEPPEAPTVRDAPADHEPPTVREARPVREPPTLPQAPTGRRER